MPDKTTPYTVPAAGTHVYLKNPDGTVRSAPVVRAYPARLSRSPDGADIAVPGERDRIPYGEYSLTPPPSTPAPPTLS